MEELRKSDRIEPVSNRDRGVKHKVADRRYRWMRTVRLDKKFGKNGSDKRMDEEITLLEVRHLHKDYGNGAVLEDISLNLKKGECWLIRSRLKIRD